MVENSYNNGDYSNDIIPMNPVSEGTDGNDHVIKRRAIGKVFGKIFDANGANLTEEFLGKIPFDLGYFVDACKTLKEDILPEDLLVRRLEEFWSMKDNKFKFALQHGMDLVLLVTPTMDTGDDFSAESVDGYAYFSNARVINGESTDLSSRPGPFLDVIPEEMRDTCRLPIVWNTDAEGNVSHMMMGDEYIKFHNAYVDAFNCLRRLFGFEPLDTGKLYMTIEDYKQKMGFTAQSQVPPSA